jgi:hypothetical protein
MEYDRLPSKPVVKSLTSAQADFNSWLAQNNFSLLRDADGIDWHLVMSFTQLPSELDRHQGNWIATLQIGVDITAQKLVETGTLDQQDDARLIYLAGRNPIPLRMKKMQHEALGELAMREKISRILPELRDNFNKLSLHEIKRDLVGRWVESLSTFGELERLGVDRGGLEANEDSF